MGNRHSAMQSQGFIHSILSIAPLLITLINQSVLIAYIYDPCGLRPYVSIDITCHSAQGHVGYMCAAGTFPYIRHKPACMDIQYGC